MTQRNPMNDRYQSEEKIGKTRKSAASAKPATKAAASVRMESTSAPKKSGFFGKAKSTANTKTSKATGTTPRNAREDAAYYTPDTPEYKKWRRYWWIAIGVAMALTALSFLIMMVLPDQPVIGYVMLGLAYAILAFSIWIDLAKVRKIRNNYRDKMIASKSKAEKANRKAAKEAEKKAAEEAEAKAAKEAAEKQARKEKFHSLFGGKKGNAAKAADGAEKTADAAAKDAEAK